MFRIGDLIRSKELHCDSYSIESGSYLLLITDMTDRKIYVRAIEGVSEYYLGNETSFSINYASGIFETTTEEEFKTRLKDKGYQEYEFYKVFNYCELIDAFKYKEPYLLSEEQREALINETINLLNEYHYPTTVEAVGKIIDTWAANNGDLIRMMEKDPDYNGKFQIVKDYEFDRKIDTKAILSFCDWIGNIADTFLKETQVGEFTLEELQRRKTFSASMYNIFVSHEEVETVNGHNLQYFFEEYKKVDSLINENYFRSTEIQIDATGRKAYTKESWKLQNKIITLNSLIRKRLYYSPTHILDNDLYDMLSENGFSSVKVGQKVSRAINQICVDLGISNLDDYNKEFAKFSDAVNPKKIKRKVVISCHPIDYYTQSFGNSWGSCHTIDKYNQRGVDSEKIFQGCNSSGVESYMLDSTSFVFYTVDEKYNGNEIELEPKINRCMFHYNDGTLLQGRVYPQCNDTGSSELYTAIRQIMQKFIANTFEEEVTSWEKEPSFSSILSKGTHYEDYFNFNMCNMSYLVRTNTESDNKKPIVVIGHNPICPSCGKTHLHKANICCIDCEEEYIENIGAIDE